MNPRKPPKQESLLPSLRNCARRKPRASCAEDFRNSQHALPTGEFHGIAPYDISQTNSSRLLEMSASSILAKQNEISRTNNIRPNETPSETYENGKIRHHDTAEISKIPDYNSNCNSELNEMYKLHSGSLANDVLDMSKDNDLNVTQMTCLDDSFSVLPASHRKISPALGPNG